ncbi:MAG: hypothetical protein ACRDTG_31650 [Pseudonocardiaceae bacterium]
MAEVEDSIVVPVLAYDGKVVFVTLPRRLFVGSLGAAALVGMTDARSGNQLVRIPESEGASVFDADPVEHFQQMKKTLMDNDNLFGAGSVVQSLQEQISTIQRLRRNYRGAGQQKLLQVQIQFADLCGWAYQDSGDYQASTYWSGRALEWSHMCDDREGTSFILARRSQLAADMGNPTEAIDAAEAALKMMSGESGRVIVAAWTYAAHGHALRQDGVSCERSYAMAQDLLERLETDPACPWALFLDRSYIEVQRARSLTFLGEYGAAIKLFQEAISALPGGYRRDRGVYLAREAVAHVGNGDAEQACAAGFQALVIGAETGSGRIIGELESLDTALKRFRSTSSVADFREAMNEKFPYRRLGVT